jgi:hypothetical protein
MPRKQPTNHHYARTFAELAEYVALADNPKNALYNCHSELFNELMSFKPNNSVFLSTLLEQQGKEVVANYILFVSHACEKPDVPRFKCRNAWNTSIEVHPANPVAYAASLDVDDHKY